MNNYRPIALLSSISKVFAKLMHSRIYNYLEKFDLLYDRQFGFREKYATIDALAELTERIRLGNDKIINCSLFIDLKKTFDTLDHKILLSKMEKYGISGNCYHWFQSYLSERLQCVHINDYTSDWLPIKTGIPQGSVLGPLLFLIYINNLKDVTSHSDVFLFTDDTNITSRSSSIEIFQNDLTNVANWLCANKLTINTDKTTVISFNKSRSASNIDIKLLETVYKPESSCKYLGVVLDSKLSFFHHIQKIKTKLGRHCGVISNMRHYIPKSNLLKYYQSNIKPVIQYGILVYGGTSFSNLNQILILQRKIVQMIYFKSKFDSIMEALIDNKISTVHDFCVKVLRLFFESKTFYSFFEYIVFFETLQLQHKEIQIYFICYPLL